MDAMDVIWMKYISHYTTDDIDDIGEIDSHRYTLSSVRLKYPGTMPPGPHKRAHAAARHSHMSTANGVRIVVLRLCILCMHTPVSGGRGFETRLRRDGGRIHTGPNIGHPG